MCFKKQKKITKPLTMMQLPEHHCKWLIPASEVLHTTTNNILVNVVIKLRPLQKSGSKMSEMYLS